MFGFSLAAQLFQGSANRTWHRVAQFTSILWDKFKPIRPPIMPRSKRRQHSRSRSRSHSHDKDREVKRRKVDCVESPNHKSSVSREDTIDEEHPLTESVNSMVGIEEKSSENVDLESTIEEGGKVIDVEDKLIMTPKKVMSPIQLQKDHPSNSMEDEDKSIEEMDLSKNVDLESTVEEDDKVIEIKDSAVDKLRVTPKKPMSPLQLQKKLESEKKKQQRQQEREERDKKKEQARLEKLKSKEEKQKKIELKNKEKEQKEEQKRREKEEKLAKLQEREEEKRKEREKKQQEIDEKNKEKQKQDEIKQKTAAAFVNFFVPTKKASGEPVKAVEEQKLFKPFQVKTDMRLPLQKRKPLTESDKDRLVKYLSEQDENESYLKDLKQGKTVGKCSKTWPFGDPSDDVVVVEEEFGDTICEDKPKLQKMRAKFFKFHQNRRPPFFGTWRKKSAVITPRRPFTLDKLHLDYEVDSDDEWEEEEQGESLNNSEDEEEKEEPANEDYEVDNDFFVPHGHLSDDEIDDESTARLSPESLKQKLKLLKDEFELDMNTKTQKIKPRSIGCVWFNKDGSNVEEAIFRHLRPLSIITNGVVNIKKRSVFVPMGRSSNIKKTPAGKDLKEELLPAFVKLIHGNVNKRKAIVAEFLKYLEDNGHLVEVTKAYLSRRVKDLAEWKKCADDGPVPNKFCWVVNEDVSKKYNVV